ncbi:uncharacterized protein [Amphiura filiformis]|uniref:uncharacterized protein n=1 Tax=Amphiura filiformis TaxID=82378 RepID=UPI003B2169F2
MATNLSEPPGQPPGPQAKEKSLEGKADSNKVTMDSTQENLNSSTEGKLSFTGSKRKTVSNESEDEDKSESLDDICRKKFKPIAPKPFLKKDQHQSVVVTAMPVKEGSDIDKSVSCVDSESPTKGAMIFMGPNMQLYPNAPFIVHPPPLVPCSGSVVPGGAFSFAMPTPVGHFVPHGYCPTGQYQACCVRIPPPVIEGRDYYVNGMRPDGQSAHKEDVSRSVDSAKITPKTKSQPALSSCSKESNKSKASRYKYSILYNGPIYKGSAPTGATAVSSPQPHVPSAPPVDSFVPKTESDNAGNVKLSLPAVLTSTGVLQITVPSLRSIEPKLTNNPSAFPQIKLQTIHGAVLTPGVLPTVLSPQHHPNSGHVVVVSAHNQVSTSSQVSTPSPMSRHSHVTVSNKPVPTRVNVSTTVSARTDLAISRTVASTTNVVFSSNSRPVCNTAVITSRPNVPEHSTSMSTPTTTNNNPEGRSATNDQSLRCILGGVNNTDTTSSTMPTTTVPNLVNTPSVRNALHRSSNPMLSSEDPSQTPLRVPASITGTNHGSHTSDHGSHISDHGSHTSDPIRSLGGNSQPPSRTSLLNRTNAPDSRQHSSNSSVGTPVGHSVNNQPNCENMSIPSGPNDHSAMSQTSNRTRLMTNASPELSARWPRAENTNSTTHNLSSARNADESVRLRSRIQGTERTQVPTTAVTSTMAYTGCSSVSNPSSHAIPPRTVSLTQQVAIPRLSKSSGSSVGSVPQEQRQAVSTSSGQRNMMPHSGEAPMTVPNNSGSNVGVANQRSGEAPMTVPNNSGANVGVANQRSGSNHMHQQRLVEKEPTSGTNVNSPHQVVDTSPASRSVRGLPPQSDHTAVGIQQVPITNRSDSNAPRSSGNPTNMINNSNAPRSSGNPTNMINNSISNSVGSNLGGETNRSDSMSSGMRSNSSADAKRQTHSQQYPQMSSRMPQTQQSLSSTGQVQQFPAQTPSTQSSQPPTNVQPQAYSSSMRGLHAMSLLDRRQQAIAGLMVYQSLLLKIRFSHQLVSHHHPRKPITHQLCSLVQEITLPIQHKVPVIAHKSGSYIPDKKGQPLVWGRGFPIEDRNFETAQNSRFNSMQAGKNTTSRPWQTTNESSTSGMIGAYGGLGLRGRSSSASQLADSDRYNANSISHQHTDRFITPLSDNINDESDLHVQSVPLHSNVASNTRQAMNDVITRRASKTSRPQPRRSSELLQTSSDSRSGRTGSVTDPILSTEQAGSSNNRTNYTSSMISPERSQSGVGVPHSVSNHISHGGSSGGIIHSDSIPRLPIVHPMLYGNSPNLGGLHAMPLPGHSVARHNLPQHPLTPPPPPPPPSHQTPPRPGSHMHNHMFMPSPYASMHRPLYMPAPSPRPPDIGLMSPRTYGHVHDSGLYSPRFQSMQNLQSSSSLADSILSSHLARTFSDDRLDTCCSGMHAHSPPAPTNTRHILPPGFSSTGSTFGHTLPFPPSPSPTAAASFNSHPTGDTNVNRPLSLPPSSTPSGSLLQQQCPSSYQRPPDTAIPSDIFGPSHLERVPHSMMPHSSSTQMSNTATCVSSAPSVPAPLTVQTNLNMSSNTNPSTSSSSSSNMHSDSTSANTPTGTSRNSPPTSASSPMSSNNGSTPLPARLFVGNTSDKYLPLEETTPPSSASSNGPAPNNTAALNSDQVVKFGDVVLQCSRQILRESGRTVLCCWHCDYHTAEPKKMYRHQKKDAKTMKCQLCDFKGYSRCTINQHFKEKHMDKM